MKKKVVLHVLNSNLYAGAENVIITIIRHYDDRYRGVYAVMPGGAIEKILKKNGIASYPLKSLTPTGLKKVIQNVKPDVIHAHDYRASMIAAWVSPVPVVSHLHNNAPWIRKLGLRSVIFGLSCRRYKKILLVSHAILDEFIFAKAMQKKAKMIGNPIDFAAIKDKAQKASTQTAYDLLYLGRLEYVKNPLEFVHIVERVKRNNPEVKAAMIGAGSLENEVREEISQLGLEKNIVLYGFLENPYGILAEAKILCMTSRWEGFGLAAIEAMIFGKPVVAPDVGGLREMIHPSCGLLYQNKKQAVREIQNLLEDEEYYNWKSGQAFTKVQKYDNLDGYMEELYKAYEGRERGI